MKFTREETTHIRVAQEDKERLELLFKRYSHAAALKILIDTFEACSKKPA